MDYQSYKNGLIKMYNFSVTDDFLGASEGVTESGETFCKSGLCNPEFGVRDGRLPEQSCPYDTRPTKDLETGDCFDNCRYFTKGIAEHKLRIVTAKFIGKFITDEAIASVKSLAKVVRGMKGASVSASMDHTTVVDKVIESVKNFSGYEFEVDGGRIKGKKR